MKKARIIVMVLCICAAAVISGFINILGGIGLAFMVESADDTYRNCGICLFISSAFLIPGVILAAFEKVWLPAVFDVIGTVFYIFTVKMIYAIPNTLRPKMITEPLAERHLTTVIVTVLLAVLIFLNYFSEKNSAKKEKKRKAKYESENRKLSDSEKII